LVLVPVRLIVQDTFWFKVLAATSAPKLSKSKVGIKLCVARRDVNRMTGLSQQG
jgi:hypothetical protein